MVECKQETKEDKKENKERVLIDTWWNVNSDTSNGFADVKVF